MNKQPPPTQPQVSVGVKEEEGAQIPVTTKSLSNSSRVASKRIILHREVPRIMDLSVSFISYYSESEESAGFFRHG